MRNHTIAQQTLEQIDACRPGSDDVHDAGLAALAASLAGDAQVREHYDRVQRADTAIAAAMRDVEVPEDLEERLLMAVKAAELGDGDPAALARRAVQSPTADATEVSATQAGTPRRRRRVSPWRMVTAMSIVAACVLLWWVRPRGPLEVTPEAIFAVYQAEVADSESADWSAGAPEAAFEVSPLLRPRYRQTKRWRAVRVGGYRAVVHELPGVGRQGKVNLFVIRGNVTGLSHVPPERPWNTQGVSIGVWQAGDGMVYALVVRGTPHQYQQVVDYEIS